MDKTRVILVGGFLGVGKTTAVLALARNLQNAGQRCGLITNDQSDNLVDTQRAQQAGFSVAEITGGCFCCKFDALVGAAQQLNTRDTRPLDVLLAEPVGSCTDIMATVAYPLRFLHAGVFTVAPLSVLVDPQRCRELLTEDGQRSFTDKVDYIAMKQLEEAELLLLTKTDTMSSDERAQLVQLLQRQFPRARVMPLCALTGEGMGEWQHAVQSGTLGSWPAMDVDYDMYADGEARLGWLNATARVDHENAFDGNALLAQLGDAICRELHAMSAPVAHLKLTLASPDGHGMASVSCPAGGCNVELNESLRNPVNAALLTINLRAEAAPSAIERMVRAELASLPVHAIIAGLSAFRPGRPTPTHRMAAAGA